MNIGNTQDLSIIFFPLLFRNIIEPFFFIFLPHRKSEFIEEFAHLMFSMWKGNNVHEPHRFLDYFNSRYLLNKKTKTITL